jgi:putative PEP-CTERM system histidine kinase
VAQPVIWIHALVALLFAGVALAAARNARPVAPRAALVAALGLTALWALTVAGIGARDVAAHVAAGARDLGWLTMLFALTQPTRWRGGAFAAAGAAVLLAGALRVAAELAPPNATRVLSDAALAVSMLAAAAALTLAVRSRVAGAQRSGRHVLIGAMAVMWGAGLLLDGATWGGLATPRTGVLWRGLALALVGTIAAVAVHRGGDWTLRPSRTLTLRTVALSTGIAALCAVASLSGAIAAIGGTQARLVQTAFVVGAGVTILTLASTPWLRAWSKVVVAKHLFTHRYDYRVAWMRFAATLAAAGDEGRPLAERVVRAMAELADSPAGLLLIANDAGLEPSTTWQWEDAAVGSATLALAARLGATRRIVALDDVRRGSEEATALPDWLIALADAWALVPLVHGERLIGAIVLARPLVDRALDWEDFDLLGVAARQVAGYLAEDAAHAALAEAQRFEEFNRRFAFLLHDFKNLVSQMALVARNAERHADNPAFRADMIATLRDTSQRMTTILARLSHQPAGSVGEPARPVDVRALAERIADARRAQHPIEVVGSSGEAHVPPAALETAIGHLVQNAIEASAPGVPVTLAVDEREIAVIDRGAGMSAGFVRDALFKPFVSAKPNGFGLGAYEARALVAAIGGRLDVESREGEGTCFRIVLPAPDILEEAA